MVQDVNLNLLSCRQYVPDFISPYPPPPPPPFSQCFVLDRALATGNVTLTVQDNIIDTVETVATKVKVDELWVAQTKDQIVRRFLF